MKRVTRYILGASLATVALAALAALAWLGGTPEGARWLMAAVSRHSGVRMSAANVEGRLLDHLKLSGVRISSGQVGTELDGLDLKWRPLLLITGRVSIRELSLRGVRIADNTPPSGKPPELAWPKAPGISELLDVKIAALRVNGLTWSRTGRRPVVVDSVSASLGWRFRLLSLSGLSLVTPYGSLKGKAAAGFSRPFLKTDIVLDTARQAMKDVNRLAVKARLTPVRGPEQLAGKFEISAGSGSRKRLELSGEAGITRRSVNMRGLRLSATGRRGTVTGEGVVDVSAKEPSLTLKLKGSGIDLSPETGIATDLSGVVDFAGTMAQYRGSFSMANRGKDWRGGSLAGGFSGSERGVRLSSLNGRLLDGKVRGDLDIDWQKGIAVGGSLSGSDLNPARIDPKWKGVLNFDLAGNVARQGSAPLNWDVDAKLRDSELHGQALTGEAKAASVAGEISIGRLFLLGRGFHIKGAGELKRRVELAIRVSDLSRIVPGTSGEINAEGWMMWRDGRGAGALALHGKALGSRWGRAGLVDMAARLDDGKDYPLHAKAKLRHLSYGEFHAESAAIAADGTLAAHTLSTSLSAYGADLTLSLSGGYGNGAWQGNIAGISGRDETGPWKSEGGARLSVGSAGGTLAPLVIRGAGPERLELSGTISAEPRRIQLRLAWGSVNLARISRWLKGVAVAGSGSGNLRLDAAGGTSLDIAGNAVVAGTVTADGKSVTVQRGAMNVAANERGIAAALELRTGGGGVVTGTFSSKAPARPVMPEQGEIALEWKGIDLLLLRPWLPEAVKLDGAVEGRAKGLLLPGRRLDMGGDAVMARGSARWRNPDGEVNLDLRSVMATWVWRGEALNGKAELSLGDYGGVHGSFRLPLPARLPVSFETKGEVQASLSGKVREKGFLTALFPGVIRESSGELNAELRASGKWEEPLFTGELQLSRAGAYLPTAGIHLKELQLDARLERDLVRIDSLRAVSGPGRLEGSGSITLKGWRVTGYRGKLDGERFQTIYFPELQLQCTPHLTFEGTGDKVEVRGELKIPELLINGPQTGRVVEPSSDVIVEGRRKPVKKVAPIAMDVRVGVVLGDNVQVKAAGINAQLAGKVDLAFTSLDRITSRGEIRVVKGNYKTYGVNLDIVRGRLYYAGGPINRPTLDILALRTIGDVRAGVTVGGVLQEPVIKLYSTPSMSDADILSYVVLGHTLGSVSSASQSDLLAQAAGALLSTSQATDLRGELKSRLGLSTFGFESSSGATSGSSGYKPISSAPPGVALPSQSASESLLTVGKYLTPQLYLSYGRSLFTGGNLFRLRYDIFKHWQIETQTGTESGGDVFYTIEFD